MEFLEENIYDRVNAPSSYLSCNVKTYVSVRHIFMTGKNKPLSQYQNSEKISFSTFSNHERCFLLKHDYRLHTMLICRDSPVCRPCLSTGSTCWRRVSSSLSSFPRQTLFLTRCRIVLDFWWPSPRVRLVGSPPNIDGHRSIPCPSDTTRHRCLPISAWKTPNILRCKYFETWF